MQAAMRVERAFNIVKKLFGQRQRRSTVLAPTTRTVPSGRATWQDHRMGLFRRKGKDDFKALSKLIK